MDIIRIGIVVIVGIALLALQNKLSKHIVTGVLLPIVVLILGIVECVVHEKNGITFSNLLPFLIIDFILITELAEVRMAMKKNAEIKKTNS